MKSSRIQAVDHVNIEASFGLDEDLRWFYGKVARLDEVTSDGSSTPRLCFKSERIELRIRFVERTRIDGVMRRVTIAVPSLAEAVRRLDERSVAYVRLTGIAFTDRRLQALDPAGNRVEFKQEWGFGPF